MSGYYKALNAASADTLAVVVDALRISCGMRCADMRDIIKAAEAALGMDAEELRGIILPSSFPMDGETASDFCRSYKKGSGG